MWQKLMIICVALCSALVTPKSLANVQKISPEIVNELEDFLNLIPQVTVDELVAKHLLIDGGFREACKFLRSSAFHQLLEEAQQRPEVVNILDYLHLTVNENLAIIIDAARAANMAEMENEIPSGTEATQFAFVSSEKRRPSHQYIYHLQSFTSFVQELLGHLPRDKYVQLINEKRTKNANFAEFYAALRSAQLRPMVDAAMKSKNLSDILTTLSRNSIDAPSLVPVAFQVISWGPPAA